MGKYQEAVESYDKALALDPKYTKVWNNRGNALRHLERHQEAVEAYRRYLALEPGDAQGWHTLGCLLFQLERYREALSSYERASSLKPAEPLYHYNCAVALHRLGKGAQAKDRLRRVLRLDPNFSHAREDLDRLEAGPPVWWWEWWFGESWGKRVVGVFLMLLLGLYLLLPLFKEDAVFPGRVAPNVGKSYHYYVAPVAAIVLLLVFTNLRRAGGAGVDIAPLPSKEELKMEPLDSKEATEGR